MIKLSQGYHYLINFYGCEYSQINSKKEIEDIFLSSIDKRRVKILHRFFYKFKPQGVTGFFLLSASHISIHTWPEKKYAAADIFTCIDKKTTEKIITNITKKISHKNKDIVLCKRGLLMDNSKVREN